MVDSWAPIVARRRDQPFSDAQRQWQLLRRGRYLEFNLLYDRYAFALSPMFTCIDLVLCCVLYTLCIVLGNPCADELTTKQLQGRAFWPGRGPHREHHGERPAPRCLAV